MAAASAIPGTSRTGKVLVASPQEKFRMTITKGFSRRGSQSSEAAGGAEALIQLEQEEFGTLVLDPQIDDLDIDELLVTIRSRFPSLSVMVPRTQEDFEQYSLSFAGEHAVERRSGPGHDRNAGAGIV
jgi:DNA-binding response OmpR family regulator